MFFNTNSYLELTDNDPYKSGLMWLDKLDVSGAENLSGMFSEALYKQKTVDSLRNWNIKNGALIEYMFYTINIYINFTVLNKCCDNVNDIYTSSSTEEHIYNTFFAEGNIKKNKDKLPIWIGKIKGIND